MRSPNSRPSTAITAPDYGIGSGGTITLVLKSGTHDFHGELYEFNRNTDYDANDYFTKKAGQARPSFQLNEPGGNIGGPLFIPACVQQQSQSDLLLLERRMAAADPGQLTPGREYHSRQQLPNCRVVAHLHPF